MMRQIGKALLCIMAVLFLMSGCNRVNQSAEESEEVSNHRESTNTETLSPETSHSSETPQASETPEKGSKVLVVYFSRTGHTKPLAEYIAQGLPADIYEIEAKIPYTDDDIKYYTDCRADREQKDPEARPEIAGQLPDVSPYDTVFLGYPIWHGQAPKIIYTFLESTDLSGKRIIPFCTSASSPLGTSAENLHASAPESEWADGMRFAIGTGQEEIMKWVESMNIEETFPDSIRPVPVLVIEANGRLFYASLEDNASAKALTEKLNSGPITVEMHDYGSFEKVGPLPWELPRTDTEITTVPGDVILYQGTQITIYYDENTWTFTRLARIGNATKEELLQAFGDGDVSVKLYLEWSE